MDTETKILSKMLANQVQQYIKSFIPHDQVELIPGTQECFNVRKPINVTHNISSMKGERHSHLYIEKASEKLP